MLSIRGVERKRKQPKRETEKSIIIRCLTLCMTLFVSAAGDERADLLYDLEVGPPPTLLLRPQRKMSMCLSAEREGV